MYPRTTSSLLKISNYEELYDGNFLRFVEKVLKEMSHVLEVERVSYWEYTEKDRSIMCMLLYRQSKDAYSNSTILYEKDFPIYFNSIRTERFLDAHDLHNDQRTSELAAEYAREHNIFSLLDAHVIFEGQLLGILSVENVGKKRDWGTAESNYVTSVAGYISLAYSSYLRKKAEERLIESEKNYRQLFEMNPFPIWVYDLTTLRILTANDAAVETYGYSKDEFSQMTIWQLRPVHEQVRLQRYIDNKELSNESKRDWQHITKTGELLDVEVYLNIINFMGVDAKIVMVNNVTRHKKMERDRNRLLENLRSYAFFTSHNLRAPVARVLGLLELVNADDEFVKTEILQRLKVCSYELDEVIRQMNRKLDDDVFN